MHARASTELSTDRTAQRLLGRVGYHKAHQTVTRCEASGCAYKHVAQSVSHISWTLPTLLRLHLALAAAGGALCNQLTPPTALNCVQELQQTKHLQIQASRFTVGFCKTRSGTCFHRRAVGASSAPRYMKSRTPEVYCPPPARSPEPAAPSASRLHQLLCLSAGCLQPTIRTITHISKPSSLPTLSTYMRGTGTPAASTRQQPA